MKGRSPKQIHAVIVFLRRSFVAATLVVSLLSALIPLSAASAVHLCAMECCAGKAPHMDGACSSGLIKTALKVTHEPEVLCGLHAHGGGRGQLTATRQVPWKIIEADADDSDTGSCGGQHVESLHRTSSSDTAKSPSPRPSSIAAPSITSPCGSDCSTCSGGNLRKPRSREQVAVAWTGQARPPCSSHFLKSLANRTAPLCGHYEQPQPRGPPTFLS